MENFSKIVRWFFVILGVIFFILLLLLVAFFIIDPFKFRPLISSMIKTSPTSTEANQADDSTSNGSNSLLNEQQAETLRAMGINPETLPTEITPAMETCFTQKLGEQRVNEIKAGSEVSAVDYLKAKDCIQ